MNKLILSAALVCAALNVDAKTYTLGVDLSGSNPLLVDQNFANQAAKHAASEIKNLKHGDVVKLKGFGARDVALNFRDFTFRISNKIRAPKVAKIVAQYIASIPAQSSVSQSSTNLIAWLEFTSGFECQDQGSILVITDALEASSYIEPTLFAEGKKGLPAPDVDLSGCSVTFYGLGAGMAPASVKFMRKEWKTYIEQSGGSFKAVIF